MANTRTGGEILMDCLTELGAKRGFGVPGESYLALLDAMHDARPLPVRQCRHEGGAAFMAEAHGKLTGEPRPLLRHPRPRRHQRRHRHPHRPPELLPLIMFVGQVGTDKKGREAFQEIDYTAFFGPVAKWAVEIDKTERIPKLSPGPGQPRSPAAPARWWSPCPKTC